MDPDEAVQLAMQDLRTRAPNATPPRMEARQRGLDLLRAYFSPLRCFDVESEAGLDEALLPLGMGVAR